MEDLSRSMRKVAGGDILLSHIDSGYTFNQKK